MAPTLLGRPVREVSAYAFADLLIDTGPPATAARLVAWARGGPVRRVLLTHHHEDHIGGAAALAEELGLPVLGPAGAVPIFAEGLRMPIYRKIVWGGQPRTFRAEPLGEMVEGEGYRLRVVPTPGHAFSHVCFLRGGAAVAVLGGSLRPRAGEAAAADRERLAARRRRSGGCSRWSRSC